MEQIVYKNLLGLHRVGDRCGDPQFTDFLEGEYLEEQVSAINEITKYIFHQANLMLLEFVRKKAKIDKSKMFYYLFKTGNTVSNTIPIALKEYSESSYNKKEKIVLAGFGVGLSWCGGIINLKNKI